MINPSPAGLAPGAALSNNNSSLELVGLLRPLGTVLVKLQPERGACLSTVLQLPLTSV